MKFKTVLFLLTTLMLNSHGTNRGIEENDIDDQNILKFQKVINILNQDENQLAEPDANSITHELGYFPAEIYACIISHLNPSSSRKDISYLLEMRLVNKLFRDELSKIIFTNVTKDFFDCFISPNDESFEELKKFKESLDEIDELKVNEFLIMSSFSRELTHITFPNLISSIDLNNFNKLQKIVFPKIKEITFSSVNFEICNDVIYLARKFQTKPIIISEKFIDIFKDKDIALNIWLEGGQNPTGLDSNFANSLSKKIKSIHFIQGRVYGQDFHLKPFLETLSTYENLTCLSIKGYEFSRDGKLPIELFTKSLTKNLNLKILDLSHCAIPFDDLILINKSLTQSNINVYNISFNRCNYNGKPHDIWNEWKKLPSCHSTGMLFNEKSVLYNFFNSLNNSLLSSHLSSLNLAGQIVYQEHISLLFDSLSENKTITKLDLSNIFLKEEESKDLSGISEKQRENISLVHVSNFIFDHNKERADILNKFFQKNEILKIFKFEGNYITTDMLQIFCMGLSQNKTLGYLSLNDNDIHEDIYNILFTVFIEKPNFTLNIIPSKTQKSLNQFQESCISFIKEVDFRNHEIDKENKELEDSIPQTENVRFQVIYK